MNGGANAEAAGKFEPAGFWVAADSNPLASLWNDAHFGQSPSPFQVAILSGGNATDHSNHDGAAVPNFHWIDLHAGHFMLGG